MVIYRKRSTSWYWRCKIGRIVVGVCQNDVLAFLPVYCHRDSYLYASVLAFLSTKTELAMVCLALHIVRAYLCTVMTMANPSTIVIEDYIEAATFDEIEVQQANKKPKQLALLLGCVHASANGRMVDGGCKKKEDTSATER